MSLSPKKKKNFATQMLLSESGTWLDTPKADYLCTLFKRHEWEISGERKKIQWGWTRESDHPSLLVLGLHDFKTRRIALESGYEWVFDAGLNSSFTQPRISWNSLPPSREVGKSLFRTGVSQTLDEGTGKLRAHLAAALPHVDGWKRLTRSARQHRVWAL
jgi:hypothetical protein